MRSSVWSCVLWYVMICHDMSADCNFMIFCGIWMYLMVFDGICWVLSFKYFMIFWECFEMFRDVSRCFENFLGSLWDVLIWYQAWKSDDVPHLVSTERGRKLWCDIVSYYVRYVSRQAPKPIGSCRFWLWHFAKFRPRLSGKMVWLFCFFFDSNYQAHGIW